MLKRLLPLALLLSIAVVGIWFATRGAEERASERGAVSAVSPGGVPVAPASRSSAPRLVDAPTTADDAGMAGADATTRTVAATEYEAELVEGTWVEGRVVFPPDTPAEERVRVVANGLFFKHGPDHAVDVGPDGRFRVAFSKRTRVGRLALEATYLYLDEPLKIDTSSDPGSIVLEPQLGGAMRGRVTPPPDDPEAAQALVGRLVKLTAARQVGPGSWRSKVHDSVKLDASLEFEFHGLPIEGRFELGVDPLVYEPAELESLFVQPGVTGEYVLEVLPGVTLAGVVKDEAGEPVNAAQVRVDVEIHSGWNAGAYRSTITKDGAFRLEGISPGKTSLLVEAKGYEDFTLELGSLERGERREALEVVLSRGNAIRGVVLLPDGSPAAGARVTTEAEAGMQSWSSGDGVRADDEGAFTVAGLEPGTYRVSATHTTKEKVTVVSELTGRERQRTVSTKLRAAATGVEAGRSGLVLRVSTGEMLAGSVVDDSGGGVDEFQVSYGRVVDGGGYEWVPDGRNRLFRDAHGVFELDGLDTGTWRLHVSADGYLSSSPIEVEIPSPALPPILITRAAFVSGVVLDPSGEPVRDAAIEVRGGTAATTSSLGLSVVGRPDGDFNWQGTTDAGGRFELDSMRPGTIELRASAGGHAPSEPLELQLAPGGRVEDVTLQLTVGLRLTGLVVDAGGKGLPHRLVTLDRSVGQWNRSMQTDADGAFEFGGLEPGEYRAGTRPTPAELAAVGLESMDGVEEMLVRQETVQVGPRDGYVVLRPSELAPVRLYGTVTAGGRPAEGSLYVYPGGGGQGVSVALDETGAYEVALPEPGSYNVSVNLASDSNLQRTADLTGRTELRLDIDIPLGSVEGRVLGPDGPVPDTQVQAQRSKDERGEQSWSYANTQTDAEGRFAFEDLPAGTWRISAGGQNRWGASRERYLAGAALEDVVVASGATVRGADLHLVAAGAIAGRVVSAHGDAVEGMRIFLRDETGGLIQNFGYTEASAAGTFAITGLDAGMYSVSAAGAGHSTALDIEVAVRANETANVELRVDPATVLHVRTFDADGIPCSPRITVSRDGVDYASRTDWNLNQNLPEGERRLGPYPPGTYQVAASRKDASAPTQTVKLTGQAEVEIELRLE